MEQKRGREKERKWKEREGQKNRIIVEILNDV